MLFSRTWIYSNPKIPCFHISHYLYIGYTPPDEFLCLSDKKILLAKLEAAEKERLLIEEEKRKLVAIEMEKERKRLKVIADEEERVRKLEIDAENERINKFIFSFEVK